MQPTDLIPDLDELASDRLDVADLAHMPSLHNFHQMAVCAPDLLGVHFWTRDSQIFVRDGPRFLEYRSYPRLSLRIAGEPTEATSCRWFAYQAERNATVDGCEIASVVRLAFEESGLIYEIHCRNSSGTRLQLDLAIEIAGAAVGDGTAAVVWEDLAQDVLVTAATGRPDRFEQTGRTSVMGWRPVLEPGEELAIRLVQAEGPDTGEVLERARRWADDFAGVWDRTEDGWRKRWLDAFTPDNGHFSGSLPVLETKDDAVRRLYYASVLTLLVLHRTNLALSDRAFVTSGERDKGDVFFWDTSMFSRLFALLEPGGMRDQLTMFLRVDPHGGAVFNLDTSRFRGGQYLQGYSHGYWYAANDMSLFRLAHDYVAVTGDHTFLSETVGDRTVYEHMRNLATAWRSLTASDDVLADYGDIDNLLECVPSYVHGVASLNAANVWMMRAIAGWMDHLDEPEEAEGWRADAQSLASRILELYVAGEGIWAAEQPDGSRQPVRHCYDFICTARFMPDRLDDRTRREMLRFVERELLTDRWMRAMSPTDPAAAVSDRPDHGSYGAFDAWPAMVAEAMLILGFRDEGLDLLRRMVAATREGPFGQAYELFGPERDTPHAPIRIAQRGVCLREGSGGGAFAETILSGLFGFSPDLAGTVPLQPDLSPSGFRGTLHHVRFNGSLNRINRSPAGLTMELE